MKRKKLIVNVIKNNDEPLNFAENEMINVLNCLFFQFFLHLNPRKKKIRKSHCASMNDYYCDFLVSNHAGLRREKERKRKERLMEGEGE